MQKIKRFTKIIIVIFFALFSLIIVSHQHYSEQIELQIRRHQLIKAINNGDTNLYIKYAFNEDISEFTDAEMEIKKQITIEILRKYVHESGTPWPDKDLHRGFSLSSILMSGSPDFGGIGVADTEEGYKLLQLAIQKYESEYPRPSGSTLIAERQNDGTVLVGVRHSIR